MEGITLWAVIVHAPRDWNALKCGTRACASASGRTPSNMKKATKLIKSVGC